MVVDLPGAGQAAVYAVVRGLTRSDPSYYNAVLANSVLGGTSTGRLFTEIRVKRALSYGAYSSLAAQLGEGTLTASSQTKNESAADVAKVLLDEFARIASEPLDATTVANRKTLLNGAFQRQVQTSAGFNGVLAGALLRGLEPAEAVAYAERINAVTGPGRDLGDSAAGGAGAGQHRDRRRQRQVHRQVAGDPAQCRSRGGRQARPRDGGGGEDKPSPQSSPAQREGRKRIKRLRARRRRF